jgi:hypothetical protein
MVTSESSATFGQHQNRQSLFAIYPTTPKILANLTGPSSSIATSSPARRSSSALSASTAKSPEPWPPPYHRSLVATDVRAVPLRPSRYIRNGFECDWSNNGNKRERILLLELQWILCCATYKCVQVISVNEFYWDGISGHLKKYEIRHMSLKIGLFVQYLVVYTFRRGGQQKK